MFFSFLKKNTKRQIQNYVSQNSLSSQASKKLESTLLNYNIQLKPVGSQKNYFLFRYFYRSPILFVFSVLFLFLILSVTLFFPEKNIPKKGNFLIDVEQMHEVSFLPADFNLDGNFSNFSLVLKDTWKGKPFTPTIPKLITDDFTGFQGRFFTIKGNPAVGIHLKKSKHSHFHRPISPFDIQKGMLYIMKLSRNQQNFPKTKTLEKIKSSSGKMHKIMAWSEGIYGYAMVESSNDTEVLP